MRVVLADDHELVRSGLRFHLERLAPEVAVVEAATLEEALTAAKMASTDLIILDLAMPGMNGTAGLEQMRARHPNIPVVVLSGRTGREDIMGALNRGANGYLPKTLSGKAMLAALRLVLSGETYVPSIFMEERSRSGGRAGSGCPDRTRARCAGLPVPGQVEQRDRARPCDPRGDRQGPCRQHHAQIGGVEPYPGGPAGARFEG
jgi:DNA-binding NarL/FixJ family response regulator